jgi:anti-anti-sigma factor
MNCIYSYKFVNQILYVFIKGDATYLNFLTLKHFFKNYLNNYNLNDIYLDFSECNYIDSSFVGIILFINNEFKEKKNKNIKLVNLNDKIIKILDTLALFTIFEKNLTKEFDKNDLIIIKNEDELSFEEQKESIKNSHKELCKIEKNRKVFQKIVDKIN